MLVAFKWKATLMVHLQVGEVKVSTVHSVENLGAWFDSNMNMTLHINSICQSIYYHLHNIRRIRKYLPYDNRKSIVQAIIMSRLDYCNGLLYGTIFCCYYLDLPFIT